MTTIYEWLRAQPLFLFESRRVDRAKNELATTSVGLNLNGSVTTAAMRYNSYLAQIVIDTTDPSKPSISAFCGCQDFKERYHIGKSVQPCKHLIYVAMQVDIDHVPGLVASNSNPEVGPDASPDAAPSASASSPKQTPARKKATPPFPELVAAAINSEVTDLAERIIRILDAGLVPFLVGPTGCGKTSAVSMAAIQMQARFFETAGADSWTDSDLVGVRMPNGSEMPGPIGAAMERAREGETVLIFLDEFLRFHPRAQESMMRVLLPKSPEIAKAMGIQYEGSIRVTSAPFWGETWAPAESCHIVLAANPWGHTPDPALLRRVEPVRVDFGRNILALFTGRAKNAIEISWKGTADGSLPLPIEYSSLARASSPTDTSFIEGYLNRMSVLDSAAAQAFTALLDNAGQ
jgi:hypothetical protein